ncbi:hypothetical protein CPB83DRAFT_840235 [Crepidotus variabilis]|uniref:Uncharacterized protein n=1 Tax=Crepidotus variabilis TaxID=179855 RepID=A0A9P6JJA0_9AGAR|nr:hypothetical protein CPB83DRAFT_840235 [Crepidotus variabilis]
MSGHYANAGQEDSGYYSHAHQGNGWSHEPFYQPIPVHSSDSSSAYFPPSQFEQAANQDNIANYLAIPAVKALYDNFQANSQMCSSLYKRNSELQEENLRLKSEAHASQHTSFSLPALTHRSLSSALSIAPSDSISQQPSSTSSPSALNTMAALINRESRPAHYSPKVLWFKHECNEDEDTRPSKGNSARPKMQQAIRTADGNTVSLELYHLINEEARRIKKSLLQSAKDHSKRPAKGPTKTWFIDHMPDIWARKIDEFETKYPVLNLCAGKWKAETLVANALSWKSPKGKSGLGKKTKVVSKAPAVAKDSGSDSDTRSGMDIDDPAGTSSIAPTNLDSLPTTSPTPAASGTNAASALSPDLNTTHMSVPPSTPSEPVSSSQSTSKTVPNSKKCNNVGLSQVSAAVLALGSGQRPGAASTTKAREPPTVSPLNAIQVKPTYDSLKDTFLHVDFKTVPHIFELLESLKNFKAKDIKIPSATLGFLDLIENADPTAPGLDEDHTNLSWGHTEFSGWSKILTNSWESIGSVSCAFRILAAVATACHVSRYLCQANNITSTSFISDSYLREIVEHLWNIQEALKSAPAESNLPAPPQDPVLSIPRTPASIADKSLASSAAQAGNTLDSASINTSSTSSSSVASTEALNTLQVVELNEWIRTKKIEVTSKDKKQKKALVSCIEASGLVPTVSEVEAILEKFFSVRRKAQNKDSEGT